MACVGSQAADLTALAELRAGMRDRMRSSRLMDGPNFVKDLEGACQALPACDNLFCVAILPLLLGLDDDHV